MPIMSFKKYPMLNYDHHYYYLVVLTTAESCVAEWYPGLKQMSDCAV